MKYDPDWDANQALEHSITSGEDQNDPANAFGQWHGHQRLLECRERFRAGEKFALMQALRICANHDLPMPEWLSIAYISAFDKILNHKSKSWDEVLGPAIPKGKHLASLRKERQFGLSVALEVRCRHKQQGLNIDPEMFEAVGKKFNIGKTLASDYYYKYKKFYDLN